MLLKSEITIEQLRPSLDILKKIYDSIRIIDPLKKKIINYAKPRTVESLHSCYDFWSHGKICSNCVAMRAYRNKEVSFKLEYKDAAIFIVLAVPIKYSDRIVILELLKDVSKSMTVESAIGSQDIPLFETLNEISQLQIQDGLTKLFNRRYIDERLPADIINSSGQGIPLTIIFADIDRFKKINDTYGHIAGDYVLKEFSRLLQNAMQGKDGWVARYGGEEFLILLMNETGAAAQSFAEGLRKIIETASINYDENNISITSSFGVCSLSKNWSLSMEELIALADKNLYTAKSEGRNRVVASEV